MSKEYEMAFRMNAELDAKFSRVFTSAYDKIGDLERKLKDVDHMGSGGGFGRGIISGLTSIGKAGALAVGVGVATGVVAAGYAIKSSLEKAMDFESELSTIQALTGATGEEMTKMQGLALKMGAATKYNAMEAAQGIEELLKAGLTPAAVQAGALEAALNLATAGGLELADAATVMSTALNAYKKDGMSAAEASNILAGTANASATDVGKLSESLQQVSAVAAGMGLSFEDTNIALGEFANNGLAGSDAGTSLKTMLQNLQPTTKAQIALFKKLGLVTASGSNAFYDAHGNIKSIEDISGTLRNSLSKLTNQQRALTLQTMFGTDAVRAANILYEEGANGVKDFRKEMSKVTALDVARKKMDNAAGAVEQFKGALETLQISALLPTMPLIKDLANSAADLVTQYTPQITAAIEDMSTTAKDYLKTHFLNNTEFQALDLHGKIDFVFHDLMEAFNNWYDSGGSAQIDGVVTSLVDFMAKTMSDAAPAFTDAGFKIGSSIASGIISGISSGLGDLISKIPVLGVYQKGENLGNSVSGYNDMVSGTDPNKPALGNTTLSGGSEPTKKPWYQTAWDWTKDRGTGVQRWARGYADGGIVSHPELAWVGEGQSSEAIIPLNKSNRSQSLWETAGRMIGAKPAGSGSAGGGTSINYNPTIIINGNADKATIQQAVKFGNDDFEKRYDAMMTRRRLVSMR